MGFIAELMDREDRLWNEWFAVVARKGCSTRVPWRSNFVHLLMYTARRYAPFAALVASMVVMLIEQWATSSCTPKACPLVESMKLLGFVAFCVFVRLAISDSGRQTCYKTEKMDRGYPKMAIPSS